MCREKMMRAALVAAAGAITVGSPPAFAGPPFVTDDPEPVELRHWELYLATLLEHDAGSWGGTSPHIEVNYGVFPNTQLHLIAPLAFAAPADGPFQIGPGDIEVGVKWRFVQETDRSPQLGTFPLFEVPIGSMGRGLGNGAVQLFLPLWLQKSMGPWTTYGGGGVWLNAAPDTQHWWYAGWQVQRQLGGPLVVGVEVFYETPKEPDGESEARFNVGFVLDVTRHQHLLGSAGRGFIGPNLFQGYLAWLLTLGADDHESR